MNANLELLQQTYRRAIEARQRYVIATGLEKQDAKVDHVLMLHVEATKAALVEAGGTQASWYRQVWNEVTDQVRHDLSV